MIGFRHREEALLHASPEAVFAVVSDMAGHAELAGSNEVKAIRQVAGDGPGVGAAYEADEEIRIMGRVQVMTARSEVVDYDPPRQVSWTTVPSVPPQPRRIQWWFRLTPVDGGTRVAHQCEVDFGPVQNLVLKAPYAAIRGGAVKRGMRATLHNLRDRVAQPV